MSSLKYFSFQQIDPITLWFQSVHHSFQGHSILLLHNDLWAEALKQSLCSDLPNRMSYSFSLEGRRRKKGRRKGEREEGKERWAGRKEDRNSIYNSGVKYVISIFSNAFNFYSQHNYFLQLIFATIIMRMGNVPYTFIYSFLSK